MRYKKIKFKIENQIAIEIKMINFMNNIWNISDIIRNVQHRWWILIWLNEIIAHPNYAGLSHPGCTEKHNFDTIQSVCGAFLLFRSAFGVFTSYCLASSSFQVIQIEFYEPFVQYVSSKSNIRDLNIVYKIILYEKLFLMLLYISWI